MSPVRAATAVDALAEAHLDDTVRLDPLAATYFGIAGHDELMPDLSPDGFGAMSELRRRTLAAAAAAEPVDAIDRVTVAALREELEAAEAVHQIGDDAALINNIACPVQNVRDVFDLMPTDTVEHWATVAARMRAVPATLEGWSASLRAAAGHGRVSARGRIETAAGQCDQNVGPDGFFATFAAGATADDAELPDSLRGDLATAAAAAGEAYRVLAGVLREELLPVAPEPDAVGAERYAVHSRTFLGSRIDLRETYQWGVEELARITAEMAATAERILPGASVREAMAHLDADPARMLHGTEALQVWMQQKSDAAVAALADTHFDIPAEIRTLQCMIAPTHTGGIYYTQPSEDLVTRPGRMWWSVPEGVTDFTTWGELTTVYHEGVPGHHLQIAQTAYRRELLNRWRRIASWVSGHGEGWALYAERLMSDLGYLDDPGDYLGMLDAQSMRAARVVLDIGIHCGFDAPAVAGGGAWTYDKAWAFFTAHCSRDAASLRYELERYLGWPGQAPSYKIGERMWLQLRSDAQAKEGASFDLRTFHRRALDIGSVGLDVLRDAVLAG